MAITINLESCNVPVRFNSDNGIIEFVIKVDDDSIRKMSLKLENMKEVIESLDENEQDYETNKDVIRDTYDSILGDGAFDQLYADTPSLITLAGTLIPIVKGIKNEFDRRTNGQMIKSKKKKHVQHHR